MKHRCFILPKQRMKLSWGKHSYLLQPDLYYQEDCTCYCPGSRMWISTDYLTNTCLNTFVALWKFLKSYRNLSRNVNFKRSGWLSGRRELACCILRSALQFASWRTEYYKLGPAFHREAFPAFIEVLSEWWQISCSNISRRHLHLTLQLGDHQCCITVPVASFNH